MTGHAAGHGVNAEIDLGAVLLEQVGQAAHRVLGLGHGHSVARHEHHAPHTVKQHGNLLGAGRLDLARVDVVGLGAAGDLGPHAGEDDVGQRTVHRLAHDGGEDDPGRPDQRAGVAAAARPE